MLQLLLPGVSFIVAAVIASAHLSNWFQLEPSPLVPHLTVVLSVVLLQYCTAAIISSLSVRCGVKKLLIGWSSFLVSFLLLVFYAAFAVAVTFLGDFPSRRLIASYLEELPTLVAALPVTSATLTVAFLAGFGALAAVSALIAWSMASRTLELAWAASDPRGRVVVRALTYGCAVYLTVTFGVPLDWQIVAREPIAASWHNVRLISNDQYRQRNPRESALDREIERKYRELRAARRPNVVLIYVDALRADATEPYGAERPNMPFVTDLVHRGVLRQVEIGLAACSGTICGLGALLQSRPPWRQSPDNFSLPKLLAGQGYRTAYVFSSNHQGYFDLKEYYEPIHFYVDGKRFGPRESSNDYRVLDGLTELGKWDGRPVFLMIGLVSPHPLAYRRDVNRRYRPDRAAFTDSPGAFRDAYRNNYDNGIVQADDVLRNVWSWLDDNGYLRGSIVVITSDHGESLGERGIYGHARSLFNTELRVPIWISDPQNQLRNLALARQIDIAPTIVEQLGLPTPPSWAGRSLMHEDPSEWSEHFLPDLSSQIAIVRRQDTKVLKYMLNRKTGEEQLFDLATDPLELRNLIATATADQVDLMRKRAAVTLVDK